MQLLGSIASRSARCSWLQATALTESSARDGQRRVGGRPDDAPPQPAHCACRTSSTHGVCAIPALIPTAARITTLSFRVRKTPRSTMASGFRPKKRSPSTSRRRTACAPLLRCAVYAITGWRPEKPSVMGIAANEHIIIKHAEQKYYELQHPAVSATHSKRGKSDSSVLREGAPEAPRFTGRLRATFIGRQPDHA